jgi:glycerol-3-phosphate dehydrogenase subunit B
VTTVVVVGGGVAGTAAALFARAHGAEVTLVHARPGATVLGSGAVDAVAWDAPDAAARSAAARSDMDGSAAALEALGVTCPATRDALVLTSAGVVRTSTGHDRAVLDLGDARSGAVLVPRCPRFGWNADVLARAWSADGRAQKRALAVLARDATVLRFADEEALPDADLAARHDDPERIAWLAERLRETIADMTPRPVAVALPPWLGRRASRADTLTDAVGVPCGEVLSAPGGASGLRFEHARDAALARTDVRVVRADVTAVRPEVIGVTVELRAEGGQTMASLTARAVILATGGLVGGGLRVPWGPAGSMARAPGAPAPVALSIAAPADLGALGRRIAPPSAALGPVPELMARLPRPRLQSAGVLAGADGRVRGQATLFACGDVVADLSRTWLAAFSAGARAGRAAASAR